MDNYYSTAVWLLPDKRFVISWIYIMNAVPVKSQAAFVDYCIDYKVKIMSFKHGDMIPAWPAV